MTPDASPPPPGTPPLDPAPTAASPEAAEKPKRRRRVGWIITVILLSLALLGVGGVLVLTLIRLDEARDLIEKQTDLIDEKETFSAAMQELVDKAGAFEGVKVGQVVPDDAIHLLAQRGYTNRWDASAMAAVTDDVRAKTTELDGVLTAAAEEAGKNTSKTPYESVIDKLGGGYVTVALDNADKLCEEDVLGCVVSDDPYVVHIDKADAGLPYMTNFIKQGIAYHEFAHVLQITNPGPTDEADDAFKGDWERMADCFALTYLKGWKLHHTVFVTTYSYYEVDVGYGYTCNAKQKDVVRDWYEGLGYVGAPVVQG